MFKQWRVIQPSTIQTSDDSTVRIPLPNTNVLHCLLLRANITNGATNAQGLDLSNVVDEISLIGNGSEVVYHMTPELIKCWQWFHSGKGIQENISEVGGAVQRANYPIWFGPWMYDPNYYLPLSAFSSLELQVRYSPTIAAGGFVTGTFETQLLGLMTMGGQPGEYKGTYRTRRIQNFTTVASGIQQIFPPQQLPWAHLFVRCYEAAIEDGVDITNVKFHSNDGERVYLDASWNALADLNRHLNPVEVHKRMVVDRTDGDTVDTRVGRLQLAELLVREAFSDANDTFILANVDAFAGDRLTLGVYDADITAGAETFAAASADDAMQLHVVSDQVPFSVEIPMIDLDGPGFFQSKQFGEVTLELTQAAAGGDTDVVLTEVANYR